MPRHKEFDYGEKLTVARDLFWKKGYNATSMNDLVDTMKINRSSLYLTYGSKHELFLKSLDNYILQKEKEYRDTAEKSKEPLKAVKNVVRSVLQIILQDNKTCFSVNSIFELARTDHEVHRLLTKQALTGVKLLQELLERARDNGDLKTDKDPRAMAHFILSGMTSIWTTHILFNDEKLTRQMTEYLMEVIV
jgi:TetR/AcrR family transcriptional repressor of nem operon